MSHEMNEKENRKPAPAAKSQDAQKPAARPAEGQQAPVHRRKVSVVFRSQNSSSLKELPRGPRNAAGNVAKRQNGGQHAPVQKGPRPLPAGTKPVKPAVFGEAKPTAQVQAVRPAAEQQAKPQEAPKKETAAAAAAQAKEERPASALQHKNAQATRPAANNRVEERTAASAQTEPKREHTAQNAPSQKPASEAKTAAPQKNAQSQEAQKPAAQQSARTAASAPRKISDGLPQIRIVKSYADYDAAAIIARAAAARRALY